MNRKTNLILLILVVLVAGYLAFVRTPSGKESSDTSAESGRKVLTVNGADVTKLTITPSGEKPIVFQKDNGSWKIVEPFQSKADTFAVGELVTATTDLRSKGQVDAKAKSSETGLDQPAYQLELATADGKASKLAIGARSALGDTMYVQADGSSQADVVPADLYKKLTQPIDKFRDQRLTDVLATDIKQIKIASTNGTIAMQRNGNDWMMTQPQKMPVDPSEASELTSQLANLRANEFVTDDTKAARRYQLDEPEIIVWFSKDAAATQPSASQPVGTTLKLGRYDGPQKQNVYACTSDSPSIVKVSAYSLNSFRKRPFELRDRKVAEIDPGTVSRISVTTNTPATTQPTTRAASKSSVTIVPNDAMTRGPVTDSTTQPTTHPASQPTAKWLFSDRRTPADEAKINELLQQFRPLRATKYLESMPTDTKANARYIVAINTIAAGGAVSTYELHITDRGENEPPLVQYNGTVFEADRDLLSKLDLK